MQPVFMFAFWEVVVLIGAVMFWGLVLWMFVMAFSDIFRRRDMSGGVKVVWVLFIFVLPLIGVLAYLVTRPKYVSKEPEVTWAPASGTRMSPAEEIGYAKQLLDQGTITQAEFEEIKRNTGIA